MPSLIVSSRYSIDSQILRQAARNLGWETLRLDGWRIPEWFEPPDDQIALFFTAPLAFDVAEQFSRSLLGCDPDWTVQLRPEFLKRNLRQKTLAEALELEGKAFIKHAVSKAFPATIYDQQTLVKATPQIPQTALVHVSEPVNWLIEYRCFIAEQNVMAISPYIRHGRVFDDAADWLGAPQAEIDEAKRFAESVIHSGIDSPPAFVLDVGVIDNRGWAVIEVNECWASGIYSCDPNAVLEVLLRASVPLESLSSEDRRWNFKRHYFRATS